MKWSASFKSIGLDAVIFPALPLPALPNGLPGKLTACISSMFIANLLHWPSGVVPVSQVHSFEEHYEIHQIPENQRDKLAQLAQQAMQSSCGLPLAVSVLTPAFQDECCLRVMKEVERISEFTVKPSDFTRGVA